MENIRILIVEDDVVLARELQEFLSKWGYMAVCAKACSYGYKPSFL